MASKYTTLLQVLNLARTGSVVFADAEYLHASLSSKSRPSDSVWKVRYAVQIGAVKYNNGRPVDTLCSLIKPIIPLPSSSSSSSSTPTLSNITQIPTLSEDAWAFFEQLTALKREDLFTKGKDFNEVWTDFTNFVDGNPLVIMVGDREVYKWTHALHNFQNPSAVAARNGEIERMEWIRLKPLLASYEDLKGRDSGQLYEVVRVKKEEVKEGLTGHDALFDACSMGVFCSKFQL